jgi:type I restriction enzyme M protein
VDEKILSGVISMPSNIFATTGTNVSIVFLDKENEGNVTLIDASNLGKKVKEGKNQKTLLSDQDEHKIIDTFITKEAVDDFSVVVSCDDIATKNYSLSAGQYFEVKIEYENITPEEFKDKMKVFSKNLDDLYNRSHELEAEIKKQMSGIKFE